MSEAAWLPDPGGVHDLRYWDGERWTEHVSDGGVVGVELPAPGWPAPGPGRSSLRGAVSGAASLAKQAARHSRLGAAPGADDPLLVVMSRDEGKNARVSLYPDRIERVKERGLASLSRARQDTEVIPIRSVSSVQAKKAGLRTNVTVFATGNNIEFRLSHDEAQRFKDAVMALVLEGPRPGVQAPDRLAQLEKLAQLRDSGVLTEEEFAAEKARLLG